jgi:prepilin-type N-terminal cleavage/methylation domain-containing protein
LNSTIKSGVEFRVSSSGFRVRATRRVAPTPETPHLKRHTRNPGPSRAAGFTLLELIVVLFILSLAAALIAPTFSRPFGQLRLKAAARDVAALCRFARMQAITYQGVLEVVLDRRTNTYWLRGPDWIISRLGGIEHVATAEDPEQPWEVRMRQARVRTLSPGLTLKSVTLDTGPVREDERGAIAFFPQGSSTGGEVWVSDEKGRGFRVVVDPLIGLARIHDATNA